MSYLGPWHGEADMDIMFSSRLPQEDFIMPDTGYSSFLTTFDTNATSNPTSRTNQVTTLPSPTRDGLMTAIVPPPSQKVPTRDEWASHRAEITRLYRDDRKTLKEVIAFMREHRDFRATPNMYKKKISDWDIRRSLRWCEREDACRVVKQKVLAGEKVSTIMIRGQERDISLLQRHIRNGKPRKPPRLITAEAKAPYARSHNSDRSSSYKSICLLDPSVDSVQGNLHPADDQRDMEIICRNTFNLCEATEDLISVEGCSQLANHIKNAEHWSQFGHYQDVRIHIGKALDVFRVEVSSRPLGTLFAWLNLAALRLDWTKTMHFFDTFAENAFELSSLLCGQNHPMTKVIQHTARISCGPPAAIAALEVAVTTFVALKKPRETSSFVSWLRRRLAEAWRELDYVDKVGEILEQEVEACNLKASDKLKSRAVFKLARHYLRNNSDKWMDLLETYYPIDNFEAADKSTLLEWSGIIAEVEANPSGDLELAEELYRTRVAAVVHRYGKGSDYHTAVVAPLIMLLEEQERFEEAEHEKNMCRLADDMEGRMQISSADNSNGV